VEKRTIYMYTSTNIREILIKVELYKRNVCSIQLSEWRTYGQMDMGTGQKASYVWQKRPIFYARQSARHKSKYELCPMNDQTNESCLKSLMFDKKAPIFFACQSARHKSKHDMYRMNPNTNLKYKNIIWGKVHYETTSVELVLCETPTVRV